MTNAKFFFLGAGAFLMFGATLMVVMMVTHRAEANPLGVLVSSGTTCRTAAATTSLSFMSPGAATTTVSCDLFAIGGGIDDKIPNKVFMRIYETASSTASIQAARFEWSDDNVTWFADSALTTTDVATTTQMVSDYKEYRWAYASTTPGGATVPGSANTGSRTFEVPVRARYVRGILYVPAGSLNSALWAGFTAFREDRTPR